MAGGVPTNANDFIEQQLRERITELERLFDADVLCITAPIIFGLDDYIRVAVEELRSNSARQEQPRLAVILTTEGGVIEVVQRIVDTLRYHYPHISFIIPNSAYSAGTVLAMSGDEIFMDYYSRLGPIDPQVQSRNGRWVSALGYIKKWDALLDKAREGTLTDAEAQLMIFGFDQAELYQYEQARALSIAMLKAWLAQYKFKDWVETETHKNPVTPEMREMRAEEIGDKLSDSDEWHSHGNGIPMTVLQKELNLRINDLADDPDRHEKLKEYDGLLSDYTMKLGRNATLHTLHRLVPLYGGTED